MISGLPAQTLRLGDIQPRVTARLEEWFAAEFAERVLRKDSSLWSGSETDLRDRLGWIDLPQDSVTLLEPVEEVTEYLSQERIRKTFLLGMGGSSLAPEVFESTFGDPQLPRLKVVDSTHPDLVRRSIDEIDSDRFLFVVSSKSGTTLETHALFHAFWHAMERWSARPGSRFIAITDPGSALAKLASEREFQRMFATPPDVGGRFSALSAFGLVPAAISGVRLEELLNRSRAMAQACAEGRDNPGLELGAALGELALGGRDKLTIVTSPQISSFAAWLEQLVAESLGKNGRGIVPVVGEARKRPEFYSDDRVFVGLLLQSEQNEGSSLFLQFLEDVGHPVIEIRLRDRFDLGAEIFRWEMAVAAAAAVLEVQPFDQPDVELTKNLTRQALEGAAQEQLKSPPSTEIEDAEALRSGLRTWLASARKGDYICVQAFLAPSAEVDSALRALREALSDRTGLAVTGGYGPRYLHSTGQLHKGGSDRGLFLQVTGRPSSDLLVPEEDYSFGSLIAAQAAGDAAALIERGRRLLRLELTGAPEADLERLRVAVLG
jgi:transaldolase/glucose-6-phosphate isomerase